MEQFQLHKNWFNSIEDILDDVPFTKNNGKGQMSDVAAVFDIEATSFYDNNEKRATMYAFVLGINGKCIRGRSWDDFKKYINRIAEFYETNPKRKFIIYVHNLAYEFQWIKDMFEWETNFSLDARKPIYALTTSGIEFRCSYLLSGLSLEKVGENLLKYKIDKLVGDLDYDLLRHSKTPLSSKEWDYILHDGLVVMAYIQEEIERVGSIKKLPLTHTGFVRQLYRKNCFTGSERYNFYATRDALTLSEESYKQFKETYMGGFTHANARHVGKTRHNVSSYDFTSSYPAVMVSEMFPMSKPISYKPKNYDDFKDKINSYCCMFYAEFEDIESKINFEHYISASRCVSSKNAVTDNGRIVEADNVVVALTEQDFKIILRCYKWSKMRIYDFYYFYRGYLPREIVLTTLKLYQDKTELKGVEGKEQEYQVAKGMINAGYGMMVTDPCKQETRYSTDKGWYNELKSIGELIEDYNNSKTRFLYYAWGIWVTAYARANLWSGILECKEDYIYSDTDSIKILNKDNHQEYFKQYNKRITQKIKSCLQFYEIPFVMANPKTIKGVHKPLGVWDYEGTYTRFKTLGAKRYLYEDEGQIHITIAGVNKKDGAAYLKFKYHNNTNIFNNFNDKLNFPATYLDGNIEKRGAGKLCHTYIDIHYKGTLIDYLGNKNNYDELSSVHLEATGYDLSLEKQFLNYITGLEEE